MFNVFGIFNKRKPVNDTSNASGVVDKSVFPAKLYSGKISIPKGWFIFELGQSPVHLYWYCQMINGDDMVDMGANKARRVFTEEHESPFEAVQECLRLISVEQYMPT